jgi:hypothetical protein
MNSQQMPSHAREAGGEGAITHTKGPGGDTGGKRLSMVVVGAAESCMTIDLKLRVWRKRPAG